MGTAITRSKNMARQILVGEEAAGQNAVGRLLF
jgi:hypothetical protein